MFVDVAKIYIKGGDGGQGCGFLSSRKVYSSGGPDGGDGGDGGNVVFVVDPGMHTLMDFRYKTRYGRVGVQRRSNNKKGRNGKELHIRVPPAP